MRRATARWPRSVHTRLIGLARKRGLDPNLILARYGVERFLCRLSRSDHSERFVLKGALLLLAWVGDTVRPTRDADLLGLGDLSDDALLSIFGEVCRQSVEDDGLVFDPDSIAISDIRGQDRYGGKRVTLMGHLGSGRIRIQVDIGIGDVVEPAAEWMDYPTLLDFPPPRLRAYPPETVVAEKLHAMVVLGAANSRMKDLYDIYLLSETREFQRARLSRAVAATFRRRVTPIPEAAPVALSSEFLNESRVAQWRAFLARNGIEGAPDLEEVIARLAEFLLPILRDAHIGGEEGGIWTQGGRWMNGPT